MPTHGGWGGGVFKTNKQKKMKPVFGLGFLMSPVADVRSFMGLLAAVQVCVGDLVRFLKHSFEVKTKQKNTQYAQS